MTFFAPGRGRDEFEVIKFVRPATLKADNCAKTVFVSSTEIDLKDLIAALTPL